MYKLIIVDDEAAIREGMAHSFDWPSLGFTVTALCANGEEAVQKIMQDRPDVVISDIRMPKMDGMELMTWLNHNCPDVKIVILSGYSDFEYLNMSIKNRVAEYLLKPTDPDEFEDLFRRMKQTLDEERASRRLAAQGRQFLFDNWMDRLVRGRAHRAENAAFLPQAAQRGIYLENSAVLVMMLDGHAGDDEQWLFQLKQQFLATLRTALPPEAPFFFLTSEERLAAVYGAPDEQDLDYDVLLGYVAQVQRLARETLHVTVSVGISELCTEPQMLPQAYEQAKCCARQNVFCGSESVFRYSQLESALPEKQVFFRADVIEKALLNGHHAEIRRELDRVFSAFAEHPMRDWEYVDQLSMSFLLELSRWTLQYNVRFEQVMESMGNTYNDLSRCDSLITKREFLSALLYALQAELQAQRSSNRKNGSVAHQVRQLVDEEFGANGMSLEYVAGKVHKSPAYISKVFKNELGYNFSDYIAKKRMEKAAELLAASEELRIYEVAAVCGYADVSNFIKVFRKFHGVSPSEYRSTLGRGEA